jgi:mannosyltransferase
VLLGRMPEVLLLVCSIGGLATLLKPLPGTRELSTRGRATLVLIVITVLTVFFAWAMSQISPAWANRYLLIAVPPLLLLATAGLSNSGRVGLVGLLLVSFMWVQDTAPVEKSNVRAISNQLAPSLQPGDLVITTQPESVAVVAYYMPPGVKIATLTGIRQDTGVWDWRDGVTRLDATTPQKDLAPLIDRLPVGRRVVLIQPIFWSIGAWQAPWTKLIRLRSHEWEQWLSNDSKLETIEQLPLSFSPPRPNPVQATLMMKTRQ